MVTKEEAKRYLCDSAPEQCFWVNNGPVLKNLSELAGYLPEMNEDAFRHHVNSDRNDFSNWIRDVVGDQKLADELSKSRNKDSASKKLRSRLSSLKKKAG
ncbi:MAG: DUF5752 family protein [Nanoarchaeota archaeon]